MGATVPESVAVFWPGKDKVRGPMTKNETQAAGTLDLGGDLTVGRLGFGALRAGRVGASLTTRRTPNACRAVELGVDFLDAADAYGPEVGERGISSAPHPYPENLVIATKGGYARQGPGLWRTNGRPKHLRKACEGSLRRLKLDRIDLCQLHRPDRRSPFERCTEPWPNCARRARCATSASRTWTSSIWRWRGTSCPSSPSRTATT